MRPIEVVSILEPAAEGHRLEYVRHVARAAHSHGAVVRWITTARAAGSAECTQHLNDLPWLEVVCDDRLRADLRGATRVRVLRDNAAFRTSDLVVIPDGDLEILALAVGRRRRTEPEIRVLLMRSARHSGLLSAVRHTIKRAACLVARRRAGLRVFCLYDLVDADIAARLGEPLQDPVVLADPDLQHDRSEIRARRGFPEGRLVGMFGAIDGRKMPREAIAAVELAARMEPTYLVLGGKVAEEYRDDVARAHRKGLITQLSSGYIDGREMDELMAACDAVLVLNSNAGPSGILKRAAALGVPCVVAGSQTTRAVVESFRWGTAAGASAESIAAALPEAYELSFDAVELPGPRDFGERLVGAPWGGRRNA